MYKLSWFMNKYNSTVNNANRNNKRTHRLLIITLHIRNKYFQFVNASIMPLLHRAGAASLCSQSIHWIPFKSRLWLYFNAFRKSQLWQDVNDAILLFFSVINNRHFLRYKLNLNTVALSCCYAALWCTLSSSWAQKYSSWVLNTYTFIAQSDDFCRKK